ncbi:hypothetical protein P376_3253 [Streptomyces sp. HCCB10043]|uniref:Predicted protein n=1 Tax=Streptomyces filamentosus NRRL 15998 TaxID=457431 RepID=D6ADQ3_STRFL|nr:hypothetical protein [Streptomyces sp. HCCB10043]EFE76739.1 predicted protein [Streptomyces filamentosus NRRL 15998]ESU48767.1 hypothetical protein P376_3253 [Streptomyces sp. HCCB10043]EWS93709.1 hypothetical protein SSIG_04308 [Streptomyces filamentosus NRRL 11379]
MTTKSTPRTRIRAAAGVAGREAVAFGPHPGDGRARRRLHRSRDSRRRGPVDAIIGVGCVYRAARGLAYW